MLRNQMHVMAALAQQPVGQHVHNKAILLQTAFRRHMLRKAFFCLRDAAIKVQTAQRRHVQLVKWNVTLLTFPERTKAALLMRALDEKKRADKEKERADKEKSRCLKEKTKVKEMYACLQKVANMVGPSDTRYSRRMWESNPISEVVQLIVSKYAGGS